MYKYVGVGLVGLFFMMIIPSGINTIQEDGLSLYGAATIDVFDKDRNSVFTQTVHNILFDAGEDFILVQTFKGTGTDVADDVKIGAICLSAASLNTAEGTTAGTFNSNHDSADDASADVNTLNCKTDSVVTAASQVATIGPLTYTAQDDNTGNYFTGDAVVQIGVCRADTGDVDVRGCDTTLFAIADVTDVTLAANGDSVDVTYTFDISSAGT